MRIAIVGSGVAGLTLAHHLHREHEITLFEADDHVGGHVHTHDIELGGRDYAIDSGFIVFNRRTYPHFIRLLDELEVTSKESDMSFSVSCAESGLEYGGRTLNGLFAQRGNLISPRFLGLLADVARFNRRAPALLEGDQEEIGLGDYLERERFGRAFRDHYLLPMGAAIWSTDPAQMLTFPAQFLVRFFHNHGLLTVTEQPTWRVIHGGSRCYVERLIAPFRKRVLIGTPVLGVTRRHAGHPDPIELQLGDGNLPFDALFLACHSDQALALLDEPSATERALLSAIRYQQNEAVLHTDSRLLPRRRAAWSAWNYLMPEGPRGGVSLTYNMNMLQGIEAPESFCVTLNPPECGVQIDPARVIARMSYAHPLFTAEGVAAQARHREINGTARTYYAGAWWRYGFHEDGVVSALDALAHFRQDQLAPGREDQIAPRHEAA